MALATGPRALGFTVKTEAGEGLGAHSPSVPGVALEFSGRPCLRTRGRTPQYERLGNLGHTFSALVFLAAGPISLVYVEERKVWRGLETT